jgi:hypothetical protein
MATKILEYIGLAFFTLICCFPVFTMIIFSFCDRGNRFSGNVRKDLPSTLGCCLAIIIMIFLSIYLPLYFKYLK